MILCWYISFLFLLLRMRWEWWIRILLGAFHISAAYQYDDISYKFIFYLYFQRANSAKHILHMPALSFDLFFLAWGFHGLPRPLRATEGFIEPHAAYCRDLIASRFWDARGLKRMLQDIRWLIFYWILLRRLPLYHAMLPTFWYIH